MNNTTERQAIPSSQMHQTRHQNKQLPVYMTQQQTSTSATAPLQGSTLKQQNQFTATKFNQIAQGYSQIPNLQLNQSQIQQTSPTTANEDNTLTPSSRSDVFLFSSNMNNNKMEVDCTTTNPTTDFNSIEQLHQSPGMTSIKPEQEQSKPIICITCRLCPADSYYCRDCEQKYWPELQYQVPLDEAGELAGDDPRERQAGRQSSRVGRGSRGKEGDHARMELGGRTAWGKGAENKRSKPNKLDWTEPMEERAYAGRGQKDGGRMWCE